LAKRKSLLDDRTTEIETLTSDVKRSLANVKNQFGSLAEVRRTNPLGGNRQAVQHSDNVMNQLQTNIKHTTMAFMEVMEVRAENLKSLKERQEQFSASNTTHGLIPSNSMLLRGGERSRENEEETPFILDMGDMSDQQQQQQQQLLQNNTYYQSRNMAIEAIESTIAELGSIFQQVAHMVAEQRDTVQRIDTNIDDMHVNISGAQRELLKYYKNLTSSRWLMLKVFCVILAFFFLYVVVM